jgi:phage I-like protein
VAAREYRYLSPVVLIRRSDRRVVALHSAALTNKPAIAGMRPIVNSENGESAALESMGNVEESRPPDPSGTATQSGTVDGQAKALAELRAGLGLEQAADVDAVLIAASERLTAMTRERAEQEAAERVAAAAGSGKLTEGLRAWALRLAMSDPASFDAWLTAAPIVVATGRMPAPASSGGTDRTAVVTSAQAAYQREPVLSTLTSEEAWVAQALREAGLSAGEAGGEEMRSSRCA